MFDHLSRIASRIAGHPISFALALLLIIGWVISGPFFNYSEIWQLIINTSTTIITFLLIFLLQSSQNRDTFAIQAKLDELIHAVRGARNELIDCEELNEKDLAKIRKSIANLGAGEPPASTPADDKPQ